MGFNPWGAALKAKPGSLHPLTFHEALKAIVNVDADRVGLTSRRRKKRKLFTTKT